MRWFLALLLAAFVAYTVYCSATESFVKSARRIWELRWGRQVALDLYLGLVLSGFVIWLNEASAAAAAAWFGAACVFGNLVTLAYFVLHYHELVARFS